MSSTAFLNPCLCPSTTTVITSGCGDTCLCLCHVIVDEADYVTECNTGTLDLTTYKADNHDFTVCDTNPISWSLVDSDDAFFETISITTAGVITWKPLAGGPAIGNALFKVTCGMFSEIATFSVGKMDMCVGVVCGVDEVCDSCTGLCGPAPMDITVVVTTPGGTGLTV